MTEFFKTVLIFVLTLSMIFLLVCFFVVTAASDALSPADLLFEFTRASGGTEPAAENTSGVHQTAADLRFVIGRVPKGLRHGDGHHRIVCELRLSAEQRKVLCLFAPVELVRASYDIS